jgi:hypothetical protein
MLPMISGHDLGRLALEPVKVFSDAGGQAARVQKMDKRGSIDDTNPRISRGRRNSMIGFDFGVNDAT